MTPFATGPSRTVILTEGKDPLAMPVCEAAPG